MPALPTLTSEGRKNIDSFLEETVESRRVPAVFFGATNAKEEIYFNQAGEKAFGDASQGDIGPDTITELWSQTKFFTCLCAMQLVEQGLVSLDSPDDVAKHLPELVKLPLLKGYDDDGKAILVEPKNKITLRMLMSHTAGTAYPHADPDLVKYLSTNPAPTQFGPDAGVGGLLAPLVYEPGTSWRYSNSIDWTGLLVERASGLDLKLGEYMSEKLFKPCGATSLTFTPSAEELENKMIICERGEGGKIVQTATGFGFGRAKDQPPAKFHFGGHGLYGTQRDYLKVLRGVLQCDPKWRKEANLENGGSASAKPLLSPESYAELFKPSVPAVNVDKGFDGPARIVDMVGKPKYIDPPATAETVNHSIACLVTLEDLTNRRKAGSGCWSGVAKSQWWLDPTTGLAGVCATQLLVPAPDYWFEVYVGYEEKLYAALA